jgi:cytidine deaminase
MIPTKQEINLIEKAILVARKALPLKKFALGDASMGDVGAALITDKGNMYCGASIHCDCGIGFCGEHSVIAVMVSNGESRIKTICATDSNGIVLPPCGRCRELMIQINKNNLDTNIILSTTRKVKLRNLLPEIWQRKYYKRT